MLCTQESLTSEPIAGWVQRLRPDWFIGEDRSVPVISASPVPLHRKLWEWGFIIQALHERGMLAPGRRGLGFGVGREPLVSLFVGMGCEVVATDQSAQEAERTGWVDSHQHSTAADELHADFLCDRESFDQRVTFRAVDMNRIPSDLEGFDFTWSSCAFEHLGTIEHGQDFVLEQMRCLRPGGVAVHTTEFNLSSSDRTLRRGDTVVFRTRDIEWLVGRLRAQGHHVDVDLRRGTELADTLVAESISGYPHLVHRMDGITVTSMGLIVQRGEDASVGAAPTASRRLRRGLGTGLRRAHQLRQRYGRGRG